MMMRGQCCDGGHACASLTIILRNGELWVLPWHRFLHAHLDDEEFALTFAEHRVEIRGRNLGAVLGQYLGDMKLSAIRELPAEYAAAADPKETYITEIRVEANEM